MRRILYFILFLSLLPLQSFSQLDTLYVDSLKNELELTNDTLKKIEVLNYLVNAHRQSDIMRTKTYANKAIELTANFPYNEPSLTARIQQAMLYNVLGQSDSSTYYVESILKDSAKIEDGDFKNFLFYQCYMSLGVKENEAGDSDKSLSFYQKALRAGRNTPRTIEVEVTIYNNIANVYKSDGKLGQAIKYYKMAINAVRKKQKDSYQEAVILLNMGGVYSQNGNKKAAIENTKASLNIRKKLDNRVGILYCLFNLSEYYFEIDSVDIAKNYAREGVELAEEVEHYPLMARILGTLSKIHISNNDFDSAKIELQRYRTILDRYKVQDKQAKAFYHFVMGEFLLKTKSYDAALENFQKIVKNGDIIDFENQDLVYKSMAATYEAKGNWKKAHEYQQKYYTIMDSMRSEQNTRKLADFEAELINVENEKAIVVLENEKQLLDVRNQQTMMGLVGVGLFSMLILGFMGNLRRKNQTISEQNTQLEQLNQTKDRIFGIIGHDLKKPAIAFRGITKKVNYLLKKKEYDRLLVLGESIEKDANALNILTDNLLKWVLLQREILPNDATETEIRPIVEEVFDVFERVATEKNIRLTTHVLPNHKVLADKNVLSTIIRNLVDNAVKFTPEGGEVSVSTNETKDGIFISIRDSGVGMLEDKIKDLFLLKKEKTTEGTASEKGTGLGLHLVGELIKQSKGSVEVNSQIGEGTEFRIRLPQVA